MISGNGNRLNTGSIFYFTLPANSLIKPKKILTNSEIDNEINKPVRKLKILIVEDDKTPELLLKKIFDKICRRNLIRTQRN